MKKSRFTDHQILAILKQAEVGTPVPERCREHGISSATFYKWRSKFGGMDASLMARMKELEDENRRLKKLYVEAQLSTDLLKEALAKKVVMPSQRRALAAAVVDAGRTNIRHACETFWLSETAYRYTPVRLDEDALIADWLVRLTTAFRDSVASRRCKNWCLPHSSTFDDR
jgi:putative transposase